MFLDNSELKTFICNYSYITEMIISPQSCKLSLTSLFSASAWKCFASNQELWPITPALAPNPLDRVSVHISIIHWILIKIQSKVTVILTPLRVLCTPDFLFHLSQSNRIVSCSPAAFPLYLCQFGRNSLGFIVLSWRKYAKWRKILTLPKKQVCTRPPITRQ